ncbi:MAG: hypothetical protein ACKVU1_17760 [bacterium]
MKQLRARLVFAAALAAALAASVTLAPSLAMSATLDGEIYEVRISEPGKDPIVDRLSFLNAMFVSSECIQYGFTASGYAAAVMGDAVTFEVLATSAGEGTISWTGVIEGDAIEGRMVWELEGKGAATYTFTGALLPRAKHALDGKTFDVQLTPEGGKSDADVLIFDRGLFRSTACDPFGFFECTYTSEVGGGGVAFTAIAKSPAEGTTSWSGKVKGVRIDGTMSWQKEGQPPVKHAFGGFLRNAAAKDSQK